MQNNKLQGDQWSPVFKNFMIKSFDPIFDKNCKILILGSCPSVKSLEQGEYYAHKQNRFWRVMFRLLGCEVLADYDTKKQMLLNNGIGLWDTIGLCKREGSLDSAITDVVANDIPSLIKNSKVRCIVLNGNKAKSVFKHKIDGVDIICLPSTSPANAKYTFDKLFKIWQNAITPYL